MISAWRIALRDRRFLGQAAATLVYLVAASTAFSRFVVWVDSRPGAVLADPILARFGPIDFTVVTFAVIYSAISIGLLAAAREPARLLLLLQVYGSMFLVRMAAMYSIPLDPPPTMINLNDPFTRMIFGTAQSPTRDLFFSGHTSTLFILYLTAAAPRLRLAFLLGTLAIGSMVILQHAHYTVDVLAAPFFVYGTYRSVLAIRGWIEGLQRAR